MSTNGGGGGLLPRAAAQLTHMDEAMALMRQALNLISQDLDQAATVVAALWADNLGGENAAKFYGLISGAKEAATEADHMLLGAQAKVVIALVNIQRADGMEG